MPFSKEPFRDPSAPLFEQRMNELEKGEGIGEVTTAKLANEAVTPAKLSNEVPGRKQMFSTGFVIKELTATANIYALMPAEPLKKVETEVIAYGEKFPNIFAFEETGWKVGTRKIKMIVQVQYYTAAVAPTSTFQFGLAQLEAVKGAEKTIEFKVKSNKIVAGTKVEVKAPAKEVAARPESAFFELISGGLYAPMVEVTTETVAKSIVSGTFFLYQEE